MIVDSVVERVGDANSQDETFSVIAGSATDCTASLRRSAAVVTVFPPAEVPRVKALDAWVKDDRVGPGILI